jgi:hypothetical protein
MRNDDKIMGSILVLVLCIVAVVWITQQREVAQVRHAMEASYGEAPKPEGHGK